MNQCLARVARRGVLRCAVAAGLVLLWVGPAEAAAWNSVLDEVIDILTSGWARGVAVIAIILAGLAMMLNLFQLRMVIFIVLGVILVFGAPALVDLLIGAATRS